MIDVKTEELDPVFREFNVLHTEASTTAAKLKAAVRARTLAATSDAVVVLWLAGLCAFLFCLLICVSCLYWQQRARYLRKLRAATTSARRGRRRRGRRRGRGRGGG